MSNVKDPIFLHGVAPVPATGQVEGTVVNADGTPATSYNTYAGVLLYDSPTSGTTEIALPGSIVYALVEATGSVLVGTPLKVGGANGGVFVPATAGDVAAAVLLEPISLAGTSLRRVFLK